MTLSGARLLTAAALLVVGGLSMASASARESAGGQQPAANPNFTGVVTPMEAKDVTAGHRKFEAGARTAWHSHDRGQLIYAEVGRMRTGRRQQPIKDYDEGGSEYTPPNVEHWHGATPAGPLVQVNIQFGGTTKWLLKTTDEEYAAKK